MINFWRDLIVFFRYNYIEGTKLFIAYLQEVSHIQKNTR